MKFGEYVGCGSKLVTTHLEGTRFIQIVVSLKLQKYKSTV